MRKLFLLLSIVFLAGCNSSKNAAAQVAAPGTEVLPVWHTDLKVAMQLSEETKKPMLLYFTGSDWNGWCIRLREEVFETAEFAGWARQNVILVEIDFPRRVRQDAALKQQNAELAKNFKVMSYPVVWFTTAAADTEGKVSFKPLGNTGYLAGGPAAWLGRAHEIMANK